MPNTKARTTCLKDVKMSLMSLVTYQPIILCRHLPCFSQLLWAFVPGRWTPCLFSAQSWRGHRIAFSHWSRESPRLVLNLRDNSAPGSIWKIDASAVGYQLHIRFRNSPSNKMSPKILSNVMLRSHIRWGWVDLLHVIHGSVETRQIYQHTVLSCGFILRTIANIL